jgi:UDP-glucose 4-epimerase
MSSKVLITGCNGFIGRRLFRKGDFGLFRSQVPTGWGIRGDLNQPATLCKACEGVDTIFHLAGISDKYASDELHWRINYQGTCNLVEAAGGAGVKHFLFLSSAAVYSKKVSNCINEDFLCEPISSYGRSKLAAENAILEAGAKYGMHTIILRPPLVYGKGSKGVFELMVRGIRAGWFPPPPEINNRRSIIHVEDLVSVIRLAVTSSKTGGKIYLVADPICYSTRKIFDTVRACLGKSSLGWSVPADVWYLAKFLNNNLSDKVDTLFSSLCMSTARIEHELGWRAKFGLAEGLREMLI